MTRWMRLTAVAAAILVGLTAPQTSAQTEAIPLQFKLGRGEVLYYSSTTSVQSSLQIETMRSAVSVEAQARQAIRGLEVDQDGVMLIEVVLEDLRVRAGGRTEELIDAPWTLKVRPDGKVVERQTGSADLEYFPGLLPEGPVAAGDSWTRQMSIQEAGVTGRASTTVTLVAVEQVGDGRVARLRGRTEGTVTGAPNETPPGFQSRTTGTIRGNAETEWSVERGRMLKGTEEVTIDIQIEITGQGQVVTGRLEIRTAQRWELLAGEAVTPPAVPADLLIVPGKGIGAFPLDLPIAELTNRLGAPRIGSTDGGFRASSLGWPNGLTGYVDSADQNKLLGLRIADRRFRTDKGIGFGSSQGAVLLAYGMPSSVEMSIPNLGGVRVLIYNDQGIAFAITSDKTHADRGSRHAPINAVDWITVFPPGGAAKIYPLP